MVSTKKMHCRSCKDNGATVAFTENEVIKIYRDKEIFEESLYLTKEAIEIAKLSETFSTPSLVDYDMSRLEMVFKRAKGFIPSGDILRSFNYMGIRQEDIDRIFRRIGYSLAEYHNAANKLHGDFDPTNVLVDINNDRVSIIDFSRPTHANYKGYNFGSIYKDLALFVIYIKTKYPIQKIYYALRDRNRDIASSFIRGYFSRSIYKSLDCEEFMKEYNRYLDNSYLSRNVLTKLFRRTTIFDLRELGCEKK